MVGAAVAGGLAILLLLLVATGPSDPAGGVSSLDSSLARQQSAQISQAGQPLFHSRPDLDVPPVKVDVAARGSALAAHGSEPGYIFLAPKSNGPMIVDDRGDLVWFLQADTSNFRVQRYRGRKVLTWWEAPAGKQGRPTYVIANRHYKTIRRFKAGHGYGGDLHEYLLLPNGHAMITAYHAVNRDLRSLGGPRDGVVLDSIAQEVDVTTGRVVWEWHSLDHVPLRDSFNKSPSQHPDEPYDYFHINSVAPTPDGNILISGRDTGAVYKVDRRTGRIIWQLGGRRSDFRIGKGARFAWQHDAQLAGPNRLVLFDNSDAPPAAKPIRNHSRGLILRLNLRRRVASLAHQYIQPERVLASSQGNVELLPNGNVFVGWGSQPTCTEFSRGGKVLLDVHFEATNSTYRCFRMPWTGRPTERPAIASEKRPNGTVKAWASWNGDTRVARWQLLAGRSASSLAVVGSARRTGFETEVTASTRRPLVAMRGLDASGKVLGITAVTQVGSQAR
jgi:hypothetical protein